MADLGEYLLACGSKRRTDGTHDCATFPANWAFESIGVDPMAKWRGTYGDEDGAIYLIEAAGGLVALFDEGLLPHIGRRYGAPQAGDIGIVSIKGHEAGAIFTGQRWAIVLERGIGFCSLSSDEIKAVWAVL